MLKAHFKSLVLAIVLSFVLFGITHAQKEIKLRFAGTLPINHHCSQGQEMFSKLVAQKTNNQVKIEVYPAGQLHKAHAIVTAVPSGAVDLGYNLSNVWLKAPVGELSDIPFLFKSTEHAAKAWDQDGELFKAFSSEVGKRKMKALFIMCYGSLFDITNNGRQLQVPSDFEGMKIRSYSALAAESLRALGATPTSMDPGEMYLAVQNGTVDGAITGITSIRQRKLWEVGKFATVAGAAFGVMAVNMNALSWEKLTPQAQQALIEAGKEVQDWTFMESAKRDIEAMKFIRQNGVSAISLDGSAKSKWIEALAPVVDIWKKRASKSDLAVYNWVKMLD